MRAPSAMEQKLIRCCMKRFLTTRRNILALDSLCRNYAVLFARPGY